MPELARQIIAIVIGYLLGSIPTAYIATRLVAGKDIRRIGGGNVGGLNTFREAGIKPAILVGIVDLGKGAAAVAIAHWLLGLDPLFVMLAGLASVVGHNWMVWLKFSGGKGMGATVGALAVLMPLYGYPWGLLYFLGVAIILYAITRNVALSLGAGIVALPLIVWFGTGSLMGTYLAISLVVIIAAKFFPTAREAWLRTRKEKKSFIFDRGAGR